MQSFSTWRKTALLLGLIAVIAGVIKVSMNNIRPVFQQTENIPTVNDEAGIMSGEQIKFIQNYHKQFLEDHDIDYRVMSVAKDKDNDINRMAHKLFTEKKVGDLSASGRGLLLLIDSGHNQVRLEVSIALEGVYTDAFVSYIQHRQMVPFFRTSRVSDGILATTEMIITRAQKAEAGQEFTPPMVSKSAGGGAANPAQIGAGEDRTFRQGEKEVHAPLGDPRSTLDAYQKAMADRNGTPNLSIYTYATQAMLAQWTVTPAQMDNEAKSIKKCPSGTLKAGQGYTVIRRPANNRQCPPYFFKQENGAWKLDLTMMQKAIRFNHRNQWHFDLNYEPTQKPYGFAFKDWRFDKYGFPHE